MGRRWIGGRSIERLKARVIQMSCQVQPAQQRGTDGDTVASLDGEHWAIADLYDRTGKGRRKEKHGIINLADQPRSTGAIAMAQKVKDVHGQDRQANKTRRREACFDKVHASQYVLQKAENHPQKKRTVLGGRCFLDPNIVSFVASRQPGALLGFSRIEGACSQHYETGGMCVCLCMRACILGGNGRVGWL